MLWAHTLTRPEPPARHTSETYSLSGWAGLGSARFFFFARFCTFMYILLHAHSSTENRVLDSFELYRENAVQLRNCNVRFFADKMRLVVLALVIS